MEKRREIVGQISGTAIVEIEEHRLSRSGMQRNVRVIPVAITVAACPGKSVPFCQRTHNRPVKFTNPVPTESLRSSIANIVDNGLCSR
jgi:hypothetical protein